MPLKWTVLTIVGNSLVSNYQNENRKGTISQEGTSKKKSGKEQMEANGSILGVSTEQLLHWIKEKPDEERFRLSAELQSLALLEKNPKFRGDQFEVRILASDTQEARLVANVLMKWGDMSESVHFVFDSERDVISGLQMSNEAEFIYQGLPGLIHRLSQIVSSSSNVVINATSGFRAIIPYLTVFALVQQIQIVVVFEGSAQVMIIPKLPIDFKWEIVEKYYGEFLQLQDGIPLSIEILRDRSPAFQALDENGLVESAGGITFLNAIGAILFERFTSSYAIIDIDRRLFKDLQKADVNIRRILANKFSDKKIRQNKTEEKNGHYVFDDGNNSYRIYFVNNNEQPIVYRWFVDHEEHEKYLKTELPPDLHSITPIRCRISKETYEVSKF